MKIAKEISIRLDLKTEEAPSGCLLWMGPKDRNGYGKIKDRLGNTRATHRVAFSLKKGPIPTGLYVCHTCDIRSCVNPDHLFLGTARDNYWDARNKGRMAPTPVGYITRGAQNPSAVLSEDDVRAIRSDKRVAFWARKLGVSENAIRRARSRQTWNHIP